MVVFPTPGLTRSRSCALVLSIGLLIRDPCDCLWYFSRSRISLCLQNEAVLHLACAIHAVCGMVRLSDFGSMCLRNGHSLWIRIHGFKDTKGVRGGDFKPICRSHDHGHTIRLNNPRSTA